MRIFMCALLCVGLAGCDDFNDALNTDRKPVSPPGVLPADQMHGDDVAADPNPPPAGGAANPAPAAPDKSSIIGKTTAKIVDKQKAMAENPELVVVENKVSGSDPLSVAASAYISLTSRASALNFQHGLDLFKAMNDRNPTYDELTAMLKQHGIRLTELPPYQMYGYDAESGAIVILEDKADKARRYKEAGIPLDE